MTIDPMLDATCGMCKWWKADAEGADGFCHALPPTVLTDENDNAFSIRPLTDNTDPACTLFRGTQ